MESEDAPPSGRQVFHVPAGNAFSFLGSLNTDSSRRESEFSQVVEATVRAAWNDRQTLVTSDAWPHLYSVIFLGLVPGVCDASTRRYLADVCQKLTLSSTANIGAGEGPWFAFVRSAFDNLYTGVLAAHAHAVTLRQPLSTPVNAASENSSAAQAEFSRDIKQQTTEASLRDICTRLRAYRTFVETCVEDVSMTFQYPFPGVSLQQEQEQAQAQEQGQSQNVQPTGLSLMMSRVQKAFTSGVAESTILENTDSTNGFNFLTSARIDTCQRLAECECAAIAAASQGVFAQVYSSGVFSTPRDVPIPTATTYTAGRYAMASAASAACSLHARRLTGVFNLLGNIPQTLTAVKMAQTQTARLQDVMESRLSLQTPGEVYNRLQSVAVLDEDTARDQVDVGIRASEAADPLTVNLWGRMEEDIRAAADIIRTNTDTSLSGDESQKILTHALCALPLLRIFQSAVLSHRSATRSKYLQQTQARPQAGTHAGTATASMVLNQVLGFAELTAGVLVPATMPPLSAVNVPPALVRGPQASFDAPFAGASRVRGSVRPQAYISADVSSEDVLRQQRVRANRIAHAEMLTSRSASSTQSLPSQLPPSVPGKVSGSHKSPGLATSGMATGPRSQQFQAPDTKVETRSVYDVLVTDPPQYNASGVHPLAQTDNGVAKEIQAKIQSTILGAQLSNQARSNAQTRTIIELLALCWASPPSTPSIGQELYYPLGDILVNRDFNLHIWSDTSILCVGQLLLEQVADSVQYAVFVPDVLPPGPGGVPNNDEFQYITANFIDSSPTVGGRFAAAISPFPQFPQQGYTAADAASQLATSIRNAQEAGVRRAGVTIADDLLLGNPPPQLTLHQTNMLPVLQSRDVLEKLFKSNDSSPGMRFFSSTTPRTNPAHHRFDTCGVLNPASTLTGIQAVDELLQARIGINEFPGLHGAYEASYRIDCGIVRNASNYIRHMLGRVYIANTPTAAFAWECAVLAGFDNTLVHLVAAAYLALRVLLLQQGTQDPLLEAINRPDANTARDGVFNAAGASYFPLVLAELQRLVQTPPGPFANPPRMTQQQAQGMLYLIDGIIVGLANQIINAVRTGTRRIQAVHLRRQQVGANMQTASTPLAVNAIAPIRVSTGRKLRTLTFQNDLVALLLNAEAFHVQTPSGWFGMANPSSAACTLMRASIIANRNDLTKLPFWMNEFNSHLCVVNGCLKTVDYKLQYRSVHNRIGFPIVHAGDHHHTLRDFPSQYSSDTVLTVEGFQTAWMGLQVAYVLAIIDTWTIEVERVRGVASTPRLLGEHFSRYLGVTSPTWLYRIIQDYLFVTVRGTLLTHPNVNTFIQALPFVVRDGRALTYPWNWAMRLVHHDLTEELCVAELLSSSIAVKSTRPLELEGDQSAGREQRGHFTIVASDEDTKKVGIADVMSVFDAANRELNVRIAVVRCVAALVLATDGVNQVPQLSESTQNYPLLMLSLYSASKGGMLVGKVSFAELRESRLWNCSSTMLARGAALSRQVDMNALSGAIATRGIIRILRSGTQGFALWNIGMMHLETYFSFAVGRIRYRRGEFLMQTGLASLGAAAHPVVVSAMRAMSPPSSSKFITETQSNQTSDIRAQTHVDGSAGASNVPTDRKPCILAYRPDAGPAVFESEHVQQGSIHARRIMGATPPSGRLVNTLNQSLTHTLMASCSSLLPGEIAKYDPRTTTTTLAFIGAVTSQRYANSTFDLRNVDAPRFQFQERMQQFNESKLILDLRLRELTSDVSLLPSSNNTDLLYMCPSYVNVTGLLVPELRSCARYEFDIQDAPRNAAIKKNLDVLPRTFTYLAGRMKLVPGSHEAAAVWGLLRAAQKPDGVIDQDSLNATYNSFVAQVSSNQVGLTQDMRVSTWTAAVAWHGLHFKRNGKEAEEEIANIVTRAISMQDYYLNMSDVVAVRAKDGNAEISREPLLALYVLSAPAVQTASETMHASDLRQLISEEVQQFPAAMRAIYPVLGLSSEVQDFGTWWQSLLPGAGEYTIPTFEAFNYTEDVRAVVKTAFADAFQFTQTANIAGGQEGSSLSVAAAHRTFPEWCAMYAQVGTDILKNKFQQETLVGLRNGPQGRQFSLFTILLGGEFWTTVSHLENPHNNNTAVGGWPLLATHNVLQSFLEHPNAPLDISYTMPANTNSASIRATLETVRGHVPDLPIENPTPGGGFEHPRPGEGWKNLIPMSILSISSRTEAPVQRRTFESGVTDVVTAEYSTDITRAGVGSLAVAAISYGARTGLLRTSESTRNTFSQTLSTPLASVMAGVLTNALFVALARTGAGPQEHEGTSIGMLTTLGDLHSRVLFGPLILEAGARFAALNNLHSAWFIGFAVGGTLLGGTIMEACGFEAPRLSRAAGGGPTRNMEVLIRDRVQAFLRSVSASTVLRPSWELTARLCIIAAPAAMYAHLLYKWQPAATLTGLARAVALYRMSPLWDMVTEIRNSLVVRRWHFLNLSDSATTILKATAVYALNMAVVTGAWGQYLGAESVGQRSNGAQWLLYGPGVPAGVFFVVSASQLYTIFTGFRNCGADVGADVAAIASIGGAFVAGLIGSELPITLLLKTVLTSIRAAVNINYTPLGIFASVVGDMNAKLEYLDPYTFGVSKIIPWPVAALFAVDMCFFLLKHGASRRLDEKGTTVGRNPAKLRTDVAALLVNASMMYAVCSVVQSVKTSIPEGDLTYIICLPLLYDLIGAVSRMNAVPGVADRRQEQQITAIAGALLMSTLL